jgi:predicted dehydrogenase
MGLCAGVVGAGVVGRIHIDAYINDGRVLRVCVSDPNEEVLAGLREQYPAIEATYEDFNEMLRKESLDLVSVTTPDNFHRAHSEAALAAGCHVLQTKPLATTLDDGRAIVLTAERTDRKLMVAHERRFRSFTREAKAILDSGALGDVIHVRSDSIQDKRPQFAASPWYASPSAGRTAIVGSGIHEVDILRYFAGSPVHRVAAFANAKGSLSFPGNKTIEAIYSYANEVIGQTTISYEAHWPPTGPVDDGFRLIGSKGVIIGNRVIVEGEHVSTLPSDKNPVRAGSLGCIDNFLTAVNEGADVAVSGRDAFASLAAAIAADEAVDRGVFVEPAPNDFG